MRERGGLRETAVNHSRSAQMRERGGLRETAVNHSRSAQVRERGVGSAPPRSITAGPGGESAHIVSSADHARGEGKVAKSRELAAIFDRLGTTVENWAEAT